MAWNGSIWRPRGSRRLCSGRASPGPNASKDQRGGKGKQIGIAHLTLLSKSSSRRPTLHAFCIVSMSLPHRVGIVCIDQARAIDPPGDNSSNHLGYKYREIPARTEHE